MTFDPNNGGGGGLGSPGAYGFGPPVAPDTQWPTGGVPYNVPGGMPPAYDPMGPRQNPGQTLPFPPGQNVPVGGWFGEPWALSWTDGDDPTYVDRTATWQSPVFDLHPEFRTVPIPPQNTQPIWNRTGSLLIFVAIPPAGAATLLAGLNVVMWESAHPTDPRVVLDGNAVVTEETDVTGEFPSAAASAKNAARIMVSPGATQMRYWRVTLRFDLSSVNLADPTKMTVVAGFY